MPDEPSRRAPSPPPDVAQLERAFASLRFSVKPAARMRGAAATATGPSVTDRFRFALALRGRCDPRDLLPADLDTRARLATLNAVAPDCDIDASGTRTLWLLKDTIRRRVLVSRPPEEIADALRALIDPNEDATTATLRALYAGPMPDLSSLTQDQLRLFATVAELTAGHAPHQVDVPDVRRRAARLARENDYRRLLAGGFFGRERESYKLFEFLAHRLDPTHARMRHAYVWGPGGVGKSTLIAAVALRLLQHDPGTVLVHLDFDRSDLDPTRGAMLDLEVLSQAGSVDPKIDGQLRSYRERIRLQMGDELSADYAESKMRQSISAEAAGTFSRSIVSEALSWLAARRKPIVLILDTLEQIQAGGSEYWHSLDAWLSELAHAGHALEVRLLASGRVEPDSFNLAPAQEPPLRLPLGDLAREGALQLLTHRGVPASIANDVFSTFGGNPLMLHLAANLVDKAGGDTLRAITTQARAGEFPPEIVQGLLYDRFLKHIDDEDARRYAHPGLVLPEITVELIQHVVAPAIGEEIDAQRARDVFAGLERATWLLSRSADGRTLTARRDVRKLLLRLLRSDGSRADAVPRLRQAAIAYHAARPDEVNRAFVLYHQLMEVGRTNDLASFDERDLSELARHLRPYVEDFPDLVQSYLQARTKRDLGPDEALQSLPDAAWARYLAGEEGEPGFGDRLVSSSDPSIALSLWRRRPVGEPGQPPTFVLQAIAETAEWDDRAADVPAVVEYLRGQFKSTHDPDTAFVRRFTALTRLALLREPGPLPATHVDLLRESLEKSSIRQRGLAELCAVAAVAEAFAAATTAIIPERFLTGREALTSETRIYLVCARRFRRRFQWRPHLDALVTAQRDWARRVAALGDDLDGQLLRSTQQRIDGLHGAPLDAVTALLEALRTTVPLTIGAEGVSGALQEHTRALLLRGTTPEFYRPVRQALREALDEPTVTRAVMTEFREFLSVCPKDLEPDEFTPRAVRDPVTWFLALAQFADRARVLGSLLDCANNVAPGSGKLRRVREAWHAWDRAISGGFTSDWGTVRQWP